MKKFLFVAAALAVLATSCENERRTPVEDTTTRDSLQSIIDQKDNEINDMMTTLNQIQEGFREIALAENRVSIAKDGERTDKAQQIRENIQIISNTMKSNRELIEKLRQQLRESSVKADGLKEALESMVKQLEDKDKQLVQLRSELDSKDIHIAELDETINNRLRGVSRMASLEIILERFDGKLTDEEKIAAADRKNGYYRELLKQMSPADLSPEVKETLDGLRAKGLKLAIGSSSKNAKFILERIGLGDYFDAISDGNNITRSKPDPEVFEKAAQMLCVAPERCLVMEDAVSGAEAAHRGGMKAACVGDASRAGAGDYNLKSVKDVLEIL